MFPRSSLRFVRMQRSRKSQQAIYNTNRFNGYTNDHYVVGICLNRLDAQLFEPVPGCLRKRQAYSAVQVLNRGKNFPSDPKR